MKLVSLLLLFFVSVSFAVAQSKTNTDVQQQIRSLNSTITLAHDGGSSVTTLKGVSENFSESDTKRAGARAINFAVGSMYAGTSIQRSIDPLVLSVWVLSGKPRFGEDHSLVIIKDGERSGIGDARYTARRDGMEYLNFSLSRDQFRALGDTASKLVIGGREFTLTSSQRKLLSDLLAITEVK